MNKAVIFDMDGVISDTQKYHSEVESKLLERFHIQISPRELANKYAGVSDEEMFTEIFNKHGTAIKNLPAILAKKWELMRKISKKNIKAIPYALDLVISLKNKGFKLAVTSASRKTYILYILKILGIADKFDVIVSAEEVKRGKPAPDIFLLAVKRLAIRANEVIVIEDGLSGMLGAMKAKIKCIGLVSNKNGHYPATKIVTSLKQLETINLSAL